MATRLTTFWAGFCFPSLWVHKAAGQEPENDVWRWSVHNEPGHGRDLAEHLAQLRAVL